MIPINLNFDLEIIKDKFVFILLFVSLPAFFLNILFLNYLFYSNIFLPS